MASLQDPPGLSYNLLGLNLDTSVCGIHLKLAALTNGIEEYTEYNVRACKTQRAL